MSDVVNADRLARIDACPPAGMITLRGDLASADVAKAVRAATGCDLPLQRRILLEGERGVAWMSPDELLVLVPYADAGATVSKMRAALAGVHHLVVDVSDARAMFSVTGTSGIAAREVLAKLAPVDLSPHAFTPGMIRRTRAAQVPVAFWMTSEDAFRLICFRSVARYMLDLLTTSAAPGGEVGLFG